MRRGFSLLEALMVSLLVLVLLGTIGGVVSRYLSANQMLKEKDRGREAVALAIHSLRADCQTAAAFLSPAPADLTSVSILRIELLSGVATRLPDPLPTPLPGSWDPVGARDTIEYRRDVDGNLVREVMTPGGEILTLLTQVQGFAVRHVGRNLLEIQLSVTDRHRLLAITHRCGLPMGRR
jgi:hypothetical protein